LLDIGTINSKDEAQIVGLDNP